MKKAQLKRSRSAGPFHMDAPLSNLGLDPKSLGLSVSTDMPDDVLQLVFWHWSGESTGGAKGALAGMGIAAVPHPAVLLASADSAGIEQNRPSPSFDRPECRPPFLHHQHRNNSSPHVPRILWPHRTFRLLTQSWDSELRGLRLFHQFHGSGRWT